MYFDLYPGNGLTLRDAASWAELTQRAGLPGLWALEAPREPFSALAIAAAHSPQLQLRTAVAVALARNPMITAQLAHELQGFTGGRFTLGLGSQVRPHIERRFSETWSDPVARMADYVTALRAIWRTWNEGVRLEHDGPFYRHTLMTPMFDPGPNGHGPPPVVIAAVGPKMIEMATRVTDGIMLHPLSSRRTVDSAVLPLVSARVAEGGFELTCPVLIATGGSDEESAHAMAAVRKQLAFYASTPAYRWVFGLYGEADRADRLRAMSREARWDEMADLITDDLLTEFAVVAPPDDVCAQIARRYDGVLDRVGLYSPHQLSEQSWLAIAAGSN